MMLLQAVADTVGTTADSSGGGSGTEFTSIFSLMLKGGWLMIPIILLAVIAVYILIERYLAIKRASKIDPHFMENIKDYVYTGNIEAAKTLCKNSDTPTARMLEKGIIHIGKPLKHIDAAIDNVGKLEIYKMEKNVSTLATIAGAAPMLGFLGTVTGMIRAFYNIAHAGNNIDPGLLAGGIYEALVTTATGLLVGILAFIGYNFIVSLTDNVVHKMEANTIDFIDLLQDKDQRNEPSNQE
ncbi:MAG: MotA/TolQ/ExbB proton channel family protein [Bacteroidetes bacterium]|nr:MotA/TolQ/ExbB proton channel family protein [Bacteroidota bacterium]